MTKEGRSRARRGRYIGLCTFDSTKSTRNGIGVPEGTPPMDSGWEDKSRVRDFQSTWFTNRDQNKLGEQSPLQSMRRHHVTRHCDVQLRDHLFANRNRQTQSSRGRMHRQQRSTRERATEGTRWRNTAVEKDSEKRRSVVRARCREGYVKDYPAQVKEEKQMVEEKWLWNISEKNLKIFLPSDQLDSLLYTWTILLNFCFHKHSH